MEVWKDIIGYEGLYKVSSFGRIYSCHMGRGKKLQVDDEGYLRIALSKDGFTKRFGVHRLVAIAFIPNPNNYMIVNHKDEVTGNPNVDNLEWCTHKYNMAYSNVSKSMGEVEQWTKDDILIRTFTSAEEGSYITGIDNSNILKACHGKRKSAGGYKWCHVRV